MSLKGQSAYFYHSKIVQRQNYWNREFNVEYYVVSTAEPVVEKVKVSKAPGLAKSKK